MKAVVPQTGTVAKDTTYIRMAPNTSSGSNGIVMAALNEIYVINANIWTGSAWTTYSMLTIAAYRNETGCFDVAYEHTSGKAICGWAEGGFAFGVPYYSVYTGTWSGKQIFQGVVRPNIEWIRMDANLSAGSNQIFCGALGNDFNVMAYVWNGATWSSPTGNPLTTTAYTFNYGCVDVAYTRIPELSMSIVVPIMAIIILAQIFRKRRKKTNAKCEEVGSL